MTLGQVNSLWTTAVYFVNNLQPAKYKLLIFPLNEQ